MQFHDKLSTNFSSCGRDATVLNIVLASPLSILLLLTFRWSSLIGHLEIERERFERILPMKLLSYYRLRISQVLGSSQRDYFSYLIKLLLIFKFSLLRGRREIFSIIRE